MIDRVILGCASLQVEHADIMPGLGEHLGKIHVGGTDTAIAHRAEDFFGDDADPQTALHLTLGLAPREIGKRSDLEIVFLHGTFP